MVIETLEQIHEEYERLSEDMKERLARWIKEYLRSDKRFNHRISSYRLKHMFEAVERRYVTNGQFKMAMLKAGYSPYDLDELNWHFKIRKIDHRPKVLSFYEWCIAEYVSQDNDAGDLARVMQSDLDFPKTFAKKRAILTYLRRRKAYEGMKDTFCIVWTRYELEVLP